MLSLLKIKNIALIDELSVDFTDGLNLLTGETGSGKSIIVDSLGALTGSRVSNDLIKEGAEKAQIEGLFLLKPSDELKLLLDGGGIEFEADPEVAVIVRRELAANGRNRVFVNNQLVTQGLLKEIGFFLANIHGQGEQATLFNASHHIEILDGFANLTSEVEQVRQLHKGLTEVKKELDSLRADDAQKLQLLDVLTFQTAEIERLGLEAGEDDALEKEKKRLANVEKISRLSDEAYGLLYENDDAVIARLNKAAGLIEELTEFGSDFGEYKDGIESALAVLEELAISVRDFRNSVQYSPERLEEIENRLAEMGALKRKYGGTLESVLSHYEEARKRLSNIETAEEKEKELLKLFEEREDEYLKAARTLSGKRKKAAERFQGAVGEQCASVALEKARFEVRFSESVPNGFAEDGIDVVEFYFSANPGESPKPLVKVASGGEASRLMLVLKTAAGLGSDSKAVVFDEVDAGVGGRVAEAVGVKLKGLAEDQQILCVTHQPQVASLADSHFLVEKSDDGKRTRITVRRLNEEERLEEIARMLAGEEITEAARENARSMLSGKAQIASS
ncbi:MAG: DNA repair protein RecN [Acidobacteriota bacterium]|nr:DNA repair protein RecN [Acidobacteriota bacterium]MDH3528742.1 DNA repair protein RecN [Acidobacteriota bacterium]